MYLKNIMVYVDKLDKVIPFRIDILDFNLVSKID